MLLRNRFSSKTCINLTKRYLSRAELSDINSILSNPVHTSNCYFINFDNLADQKKYENINIGLIKTHINKSRDNLYNMIDDYNKVLTEIKYLDVGSNINNHDAQIMQLHELKKDLIYTDRVDQNISPEYYFAMLENELTNKSRIIHRNCFVLKNIVEKNRCCQKNEAVADKVLDLSIEKICIVVSVVCIAILCIHFAVCMIFGVR